MSQSELIKAVDILSTQLKKDLTSIVQPWIDNLDYKEFTKWFISTNATWISCLGLNFLF